MNFINNSEWRSLLLKDQDPLSFMDWSRLCLRPAASFFSWVHFCFLNHENDPKVKSRLPGHESKTKGCPSKLSAHQEENGVVQEPLLSYILLGLAFFLCSFSI